MTIATTINKVTYNGDGVTTVWSYSFSVSLSADLQVYITDSSGIATLLLSGYTVDVTNKQVTYPTSGSPLGIGSKITLLRSVDTLQSVDWKNQGPFNAEVLEQALDKSSMQVQQLTEALARSIKLPQSEVGTDTNTTLPTVANRAAMFLAFDASGNPIPASGISSTPVSAFMSTVLDDTTAVQARTTLGIYPDQSLGASGTAGSLSIFPSTALKGSLRFKASNNTGDTITDITAAPQAGARNFTIPDPGVTNSSVVLTEGAQTLNGNLGIGAAPDASIPLRVKRTGAGSVVKLENSGGTVDVEYFPSGVSKWRVGHGVSSSGYDIRDTVNAWTNLTCDPTTGEVIRRGTNTNNNAAAGYIGEYIESNVNTATNAAATGTFGDLASISLTAGDWTVTGLIVWALNGATMSQTQLGISTTSGNSSTGLTKGTNFVDQLIPTSGTDSSACIPSYRISLSATTTVYLKYRATFTVGTPQAVGSIRARRER